MNFIGELSRERNSRSLGLSVRILYSDFLGCKFLCWEARHRQNRGLIGRIWNGRKEDLMSLQKGLEPEQCSDLGAGTSRRIQYRHVQFCFFLSEVKFQGDRHDQPDGGQGEDLN